MREMQQPCDLEHTLIAVIREGESFNFEAMGVATHTTDISVLPLCICHVAFKVILGGGPQLLWH